MKKLLTALIFSFSTTSVFLLAIWVNHYIVFSLNPSLSSIFLALLILIAIPVFIKGFPWMKRNISFTPTSLFGMGCLSVLTYMLINSILFDNSRTAIRMHDVLFIVPLFNVLLVFALFFALLFCIYYLFQKIFKRELNYVLGYIHFWITFIGGYLAVWPSNYEGPAGISRRYIDYGPHFYSSSDFFFSRMGILVLAAQFIFLFNLFYSSFKRNPAKSKLQQ